MGRVTNRYLAEAIKHCTHSHAMRKIRDGEWESVNDLKPGRHNEIIDHTKSHKPRMTVYVDHDKSTRHLPENAGGPGAAGANPGTNNYAQNLPADPNKKGTKKDITKSSIASTADTMQEHIITSPDEAFQLIIDEGAAAAHRLGRDHGSKGHELPASHVEKRFGQGTHSHYMAGIEHAKNPPKPKGILGRLGLGEAKESPVKRKYMGTLRGRTATGKRAHAIDVKPTMTDKKDHNRTTPSGEKPK